MQAEGWFRNNVNKAEYLIIAYPTKNSQSVIGLVDQLSGMWFQSYTSKHLGLETNSSISHRMESHVFYITYIT